MAQAAWMACRKHSSLTEAWIDYFSEGGEKKGVLFKSTLKLYIKGWILVAGEYVLPSPHIAAGQK